MSKNGGKNPPKKAGRKRIEIDFDEVERLAARGLGPSQIADAIGVSWSTINRNRKRNADFDAIIRSGKARGLKMVTDALLESATSGNVQAQIFYLKNRDGDRWRDRQDVNVATTVSISDALSAARQRTVTIQSPATKTIEHEPQKTGRKQGQDN